MQPTATRHVLMCVSGTSPAVITETIYALIQQTPSFVPDEIHVVTTLTGKHMIEKDLLAPDVGHFHRFMRDYLPDRTVRFDDSTVHVISEEMTVMAPVNPFAGLPGMPSSAQTLTQVVALDDIATGSDNEAAADAIYRVMRELKAQPGTLLHASVAGGRKSMSFYMGHAFSLLAEPDDTLSHVLVNKPFEESDLRFYYPPVTPQQLFYTDRKGQRHEVSTADAQIGLANLSVLKLGGLLGQEWPDKAKHSFSFAVTLAQAALVPPAIKVVLGEKNGLLCGWLEVCGETIDLSPLPFAVFTLHAIACKYQGQLPEGAALKLQDLPDQLWVELGEEMDRSRFSNASDFKTAASDVREALRKKVGPVARHFVIEPVGKKSPGQKRSLALQVRPEQIQLVGLSGWWSRLRQALC